MARAEAGAIAATGPVNLNTATEKQLEDLPGVGPATAKKIIAGRPYASVSDLSKAGVSKATIDKISSMVTVGGAAAPAAPTAPASSTPSHAASKAATAPMGPVNLNTASEKELVDLPGVGPATAKKIIAGRPYASVADLSKAGVSKATIDKIGSMVTASGGAATAASGTPPPPAPPAPTKYTPPASSTPATSPASTVSATPPSPGMVWANLDSKVYHKAGDRYYGKTKHGQWMTEQQAIAAGYRAAKTEPKKTGTE